MGCSKKHASALPARSGRIPVLDGQWRLKDYWRLSDTPVHVVVGGDSNYVLQFMAEDRFQRRFNDSVLDVGTYKLALMQMWEMIDTVVSLYGSRDSSKYIFSRQGAA